MFEEQATALVGDAQGGSANGGLDSQDGDRDWGLPIEAVSRRTAGDASGSAKRDATKDTAADSLQLFLTAIGRVRLLTAAQEVELAKRIVSSAAISAQRAR